MDYVNKPPYIGNTFKMYTHGNTLTFNSKSQYIGKCPIHWKNILTSHCTMGNILSGTLYVGIHWHTLDYFGKLLYIGNMLASVLYNRNKLARSLYDGKVTIKWRYVGIHCQGSYMLVYICKVPICWHTLARSLYIGNALYGSYTVKMHQYILDCFEKTSYTLKICWQWFLFVGNTLTSLYTFKICL